MQLCILPPCSYMTHSGEANNRGVFSSSHAREPVFLSVIVASVSNPVTCSSYYWTLFHWQSRKEERRGTLIAHLNGGCHIINAYRHALRAVTETPSDTGRKEEGEWDINSCERRDGYQWPEIKWLALKQMRPGMWCLFDVELSVRVLHNIWLSASDFVACDVFAVTYLFWYQSLVFTCSHR